MDCILLTLNVYDDVDIVCMTHTDTRQKEFRIGRSAARLPSELGRDGGGECSTSEDWYINNI